MAVVISSPLLSREGKKTEKATTKGLKRPVLLIEAEIKNS